jgi:hypothetical protein
MLNRGSTTSSAGGQAIEAAQENRHPPFRRGAHLARQALRRRCLQLDGDRGLSILVFLLVLLRVGLYAERRRRHHLCDLRLVWRLMEKLDMMPQIIQQLMRLKDIRRRIEAGASIDAIGEQIQRTGTDKSGSE